MHTALTFSSVEPGDDQRWSTWTAITPSQRGPEPWPDWVITSDGAIDTELGVVKTGKEADLYLIERFAPGLTYDDPPTQSSILAAKRYRTTEHRDFHRSSEYQEGRRTRRSRDARALEKGSAYGRSLAADHWAYAEFEALSVMYERGAPVPYPVQVDGTELLMEFIGDGTVAAPRLAESRDGAAALQPLLDQVIAAMHLFAHAGYVHGDLSTVTASTSPTGSRASGSTSTPSSCSPTCCRSCSDRSDRPATVNLPETLGRYDDAMIEAWHEGGVG